MNITDDEIRARIEARLKTINAELETFAKLTTEKAVLEMLLESGSVVISQMAILAPLLVGPPVEAGPAAAAAPATPPVPKLGRGDKGSKAWEAGRAARDHAGFLDADMSPWAEACRERPYPAGSVREHGFAGGWEERNAEIVASWRDAHPGDETATIKALPEAPAHGSDQSHIPAAEQDFHQRLVEATTMRVIGDDSQVRGDPSGHSEAFLRGNAAHAAGLKRTDNPGRDGSPEFKDWRSGWDAAYAVAPAENEAASS